MKPLHLGKKAWSAFALVIAMAVAVACSSAPPPAAAPGISPAELQAALQQAVQSAPTGPTAAEIQALVQQAVEGAVPEGTSASEISAMVTAAVTAASSGAVTAGDIQSVVSKAISDAARNAPEPLTESQVAAIVSAAVMAIPPPLPVVVVAEAPTAGTNVTPDYWNPPTAFYGQPLYGGEMIVNFEDPLEHANTWGAYTATVTRLRTPTMNSLVGEDPYNPGKIIPDLASSWEQDADGQGLTFKFVEGVMWHDGQLFVCEDARFSLEVMITGEGITASEMGAKLAFIDLPNTSCKDDQRLHVRYSGGTDTALVAFIDRGFLIFQKDWFQEGGEDAMFQDVSVGTGPFIWEEGQAVGVDVQHFEANPDYFKPGLPYLDRLTIHGILDESIQQATMLAHQTNWHWVRNFGQYDSYVAHDQIQTVIRATRGHHQININSALAPFDNVNVRQAVMMGMDRGAAIKVLLDGHGSEGFIMPPGGAWDLTQEQGCAVPGWCAPAAGYDTQRAEARAILEAEGFDFDKTYVMTVESDEQVQARATLVQEQLRLLGIKTDFDTVESVAWRQQVTTGTWGNFTPANTTMPADNPGLGMSFYYGCKSGTNFQTPQNDCNETSEGLLAALASAAPGAAQRAASDELQLYLMSQYLTFPLYWEQEAAAFWPEVRGYVHQPQPSGPFMRWEQTWMDPSHADDSGFSGQTSGVPGGI